jgi:hypothetical protein
MLSNADISSKFRLFSELLQLQAPLFTCFAEAVFHFLTELQVKTSKIKKIIRDSQYLYALYILSPFSATPCSSKPLSLFPPYDFDRW